MDAHRPGEADWPAWSGAVRQAWLDLRDERDTSLAGAGALGGFSLRTLPGALRWTAFDRWAARHGIRNDDFDTLWRLLRALDTEYLEHVSRQLVKEG